MKGMEECTGTEGLGRGCREKAREEAVEAVLGVESRG